MSGGRYQGHKHHDQECYDENCGKPVQAMDTFTQQTLANQLSATRPYAAPPALPPSGDAFKRPDHYGGADNPYEVIKVLEAWGLDKDFYLGNVIKYVARAGKKDPGTYLQDLEKALEYLQFRVRACKRSAAPR